MLLMVSASAATSPFDFTVRFCFRSPLATAVTTLTMPRTCSVRLAAMKFTVSVRSFQVPATPGTCACPPSLPSVPTSRATRVTSPANALSWSTIVLMVFLSSRISPLTSTVILRERAPRATAVVTSAMLRTWPVRFDAIALTLSVRSFHVPATPGTTAWPPSLPSVPTSRSTRVTSAAKPLSWSTMVLMVFLSSRISPLTSTAILRLRSPLATAVVTSAMLRTCVVRLAASPFTLSVRSRQTPAAPGTLACPPSLPSVPTSRATRVTSPANALSWSTIVLMVFFSSRISPFTSTVILRDKSPRATAVVTSAMFRTWPVRFPAIELTESVRSFHVPATPGTFACPPNRPSVPTSRATRVTSPANRLSWSTIVFSVSFSCRISPRTSTVILRDRSPLAIAVATSAIFRTWPVRLLAMKLTLSVRSFHVPPTPGTCAWPPSLPSVPTSRATRVTSPANAFNWSTIVLMVNQLNAFAGEVTRVAREVGTEGKLGGQAQVPGVGGTWKDLTDNVNFMASNLTGQVRNIAEVATAIASGDLSRKITVDVRGEILQLKETLNTMVDQLNRFAGEVTRVAREVGTEGRLGGQANVPGVAGTWKDLTDNVNSMAGNLTGQVRNIAEVTTAVAKGDLSKKITVDVKGEILELKNTVNTMVDQLNAFASEVTRVAREVGTEGKLGGQAQVPEVAGTWKDLTDNVNFMASNLTAQVRNIAEVATAIAGGDLSKKITVDVRGEILLLKDTLNTMVEQLRSFAAEVTRVAREVGTEGRLGGQAVVPGVGGTFKDLTDNVNLLAANLTTQVRNIAEVTTAVARGDLSRKITVDVKGEILELKNTINTMVDQLNAFAGEVTRVAREVGTEGKLGGQAQVPGVAGTWKDLTDNVNFMAGNLTAQVRNIAEVATAVARGDLSRKITVDVRGEILELKDTINTMVDQLRSF